MAIGKDEYLDFITYEGLRYKVFPLQTIQSLSERWNVSRQLVYTWSQSHLDFPKPIEGIITATAKTPTVYPLYEVERYENLRGGSHKIAEVNKGRAGRPKGGAK